MKNSFYFGFWSLNRCGEEEDLLGCGRWEGKKEAFWVFWFVFSEEGKRKGKE